MWKIGTYDFHVKVECNHCEKSRHIKPYCHVTLKGANVAHETTEFEQFKWEHCLSIKVVDQLIIATIFIQLIDINLNVNVSINYSKD